MIMYFFFSKNKMVNLRCFLISPILPIFNNNKKKKKKDNITQGTKYG